MKSRYNEVPTTKRYVFGAQQPNCNCQILQYKSRYNEKSHVKPGRFMYSTFCYFKRHTAIRYSETLLQKNPVAVRLQSPRTVLLCRRYFVITRLHCIAKIWFQKLLAVWIERDIKPCDINNMDETGFRIGTGGKQRVITRNVIFSWSVSIYLALLIEAIMLGV